MSEPNRFGNRLILDTAVTAIFGVAAGRMLLAAEPAPVSGLIAAGLTVCMAHDVALRYWALYKNFRSSLRLKV
jgi:hypothetical protein